MVDFVKILVGIDGIMYFLRLLNRGNFSFSNLIVDGFVVFGIR